MPKAAIYLNTVLTTSYWPADTSQPLLDITLGDALRGAAAEVPDRAAFIEGIADAAQRRRWTYAELLAHAERVAAALLTRFAPGERVALWSDNRAEWGPLLYGCALAGIVLVTVNPAYKSREMQYVLDKSESAGLFVMPEYRGFDTLAAARAAQASLPKLRDIHCLTEFDAFVARGAGGAVLPLVSPRDPCMIMFTSGTTGAQKGVVFHHQGIINVVNFTQERGGLAPGGVFVNPMPMFHIGALGHAGVGTVVRRATHVLAREWNAELFMRLVESERGTYSLLVPTMIEAILAHPDRARFDIATLRNLVSGAAVVEAALIRRTKAEIDCTICNIYGQTEMQGVISGVHRDDAEIDMAETIGQPMPQVEVKIGDPVTGEVLPLGAEGEIYVRGYQLMLGYFNMPEETAKTITPEGWLHSGDLGSMDARGFLKITGRIKEMIIRGGENIYPREIENLLLEHPLITHVAVVGVADPVWGEQVAAVIRTTSPEQRPTAAELHAFCRTHLAAYKTPRQWYFLDEFPHTETGKVQKFRLKELIAGGALERAG